MVEDQDLYAEQLWIARAIAAPDAWRLRATNAAGLLSAAAAATVAGLVLRGRPDSDLATVLIVVAVSAYAVAVAAFMIGSVWRPKPRSGRPDQPPENQTSELPPSTDDIWDSCEAEAKPLRRFVFTGVAFGVMAVLLTGSAAIALGLADATEVVDNSDVFILDNATADGILEICSEISVPLLEGVRLAIDGDEVTVELSETVCGDSEVKLGLERSAVIWTLD